MKLILTDFFLQFTALANDVEGCIVCLNANCGDADIVDLDIINQRLGRQRIGWRAGRDRQIKEIEMIPRAQQRKWMS